MIRSLTLLLFILITGISCTTLHRPTEVLPPQKMQAVLWDFFRAGNHVTSHLLPKDSTLRREPEQIKWFNRVLAIHQVSEKQFKLSLDYYTSHPASFTPILDSLSKMGQAPVIKTKVPVKAVQ